MNSSVSLSEVQRWANDPDSAKSNMRRLLPLVVEDEELANWGTEALENCGAPLITDLPWIANQATDSQPDIAFWACTLLGRAGQCASTFTSVLESLRDSAEAPSQVKKRAHWALEQIASDPSPAGRT